jgi:thiol-disulfide isomerase/thioredoxin
MRAFYFLCLLLLTGIGSSAQNKPLPYKIEGHINADTGTVRLTFSADSSFYPAEFKQQTTRVANKRFTFEGVMPYPQSVEIIYGNLRYVSAAIVIEPGTQTITCNIDSSKKVPQIDNRIMNEHKTEFENAYTEVYKTEAKIKAEWDSLTKVYNNKVPQSAQLSFRQLIKLSYTQGDEALLNCVKQFPDSYVKFWTLVRLSGFGYENIHSDIYKALSPALKATYTGKVLGQKLMVVGSLTAIGKSFPQVRSVTAENEALQQALYLKNKFTLVDFWYSNCAPCIAQFDELKNIYKDYHNKGLEIVGISTDRIKAEQNWKNLIKGRQLPWLQYWDKDGIESRKLAITAFPSNFLLDSNGTIVQKNISPSELRDFLQKNINPPAL